MTDEPQKWRIFILFPPSSKPFFEPSSVHSSTSFFLFPCVPWDPTSSELEPGRLPEYLWRHLLFLFFTSHIHGVPVVYHHADALTWLFLKINLSVSFTSLTPGAFPLLRSQYCLNTCICTPTRQPPSSFSFFFSSSPTCSLIIFILLQCSQSQNTITDLYFFQ
ncbi:hypothetical protein CPB84DRAFT_1799847, partial [Gymnopilus junonius]